MFQTLAMVSAIALGAHGAPRNQIHADTTTYTGTFADGATYLIEVPKKWNGTFVLYSHGYVVPGSSNPALDVGDPVTGKYLLSKGYALGGSSYATTGWAIQQALPDQVEVLSTFETLVGQPKRTLAWGHSLGGMVTAGLVQQYPTLFNGALPMCGVVGGGVGIWNVALDGAFVFNTLLAGNSLQVVNITNPDYNYEAAETVLGNAQSTAQGQARIALAAAVADTPGWYNPAYPPPAPTDYTDQEANQYDWFAQVDFAFDFALRAELEARAGGNPSWNTGVDYKTQLAHSVNKAEVVALYQAAGLSLDADLATLAAAQRISADTYAVTYLSQNIIFDGQISIPVLTMHTEGDGLVGNQNESAYKLAVDGAGDQADLRRTFIYRAGHCEFTPAEQITALESLISRLDTGRWPNLTPATLNGVASALGSTYNTVPPEFDAYRPAPFLRLYNGTP